MLEGLVEKLILAYLGDYIENLDKSKLNIGVNNYYQNINLNALLKFIKDLVRKFRHRRYNN